MFIIMLYNNNNNNNNNIVITQFQNFHLPATLSINTFSWVTDHVFVIQTDLRVTLVPRTLWVHTPSVQGWWCLSSGDPCVCCHSKTAKSPSKIQNTLYHKEKKSKRLWTLIKKFQVTIPYKHLTSSSRIELMEPILQNKNKMPMGHFAHLHHCSKQ